MSTSAAERASERPMIVPPVRPEFVRDTLDASNIGEIERPLSAWERISSSPLTIECHIAAIVSVKVGNSSGLSSGTA